MKNFFKSFHLPKRPQLRPEIKSGVKDVLKASNPISVPTRIKVKKMLHRIEIGVMGLRTTDYLSTLALKNSKFLADDGECYAAAYAKTRDQLRTYQIELETLLQPNVLDQLTKSDLRRAKSLNDQIQRYLANNTHDKCLDRMTLMAAQYSRTKHVPA